MQAFQRKIPIYSAYPYNKNQNGGYKPQNEKIRKVQWFRLPGYDCLYCSEKHRAREGEKIQTYTEIQKEKTA